MPQESPRNANEHAAPRALPPDAHPMMMDPLGQMVNDLANNAQTLLMIFNEKTRRAEESSRHLPENERPLPDMAELKAVIDAQAQAVQAALAYRNDQRQGMAFEAAYRRPEDKDKESKIGFGDYKRPPSRLPAPTRPSAP